MKFKSKSFIIIFTSSILSSCGGGDSNKDEMIIENKASLTQENYIIVAKEALKLSPLLRYEGFAMQEANGMQAILLPGINSIRSIIERSPENFPRAITYAECAFGGSITYKEYDNNNNKIIDAGDSFEITHQKCNAKQDGSLLITIVTKDNATPSGAPNIGASLKYENYTTHSENTISTGNGIVNFDAEYLSYRTINTKIKAENFILKTSTQKATNIQTINEYQASSNIRDPFFESSVASTVTASILDNKSITIITPTPFKNAPSSYPLTGSMVITGANQASIRIIAIDTNNAKVELDQNGDGTYEVNQIASWNDLINP